MEIKVGTTVKSTDGEKIGTIDRVVIDPTRDEVTHIVVRKGFLFTEDRVIPVNMLAQTGGGTIVVITTAERLENFPLFEETYFISPDTDKLPLELEGASPSPLLYYPPAGALGNPLYAAVLTGAMTEHVNRNIPKHNVAISSDTRITTSDGEDAGHIEKTITDDDGNITHLLISKGMIFHTERLIPIYWVYWVSDDELRLSVPTEVVESVPEFNG